jgi:hypothetical protein
MMSNINKTTEELQKSFQSLHDNTISKLCEELKSLKDTKTTLIDVKAMYDPIIKCNKLLVPTPSN